MRYALLFLIALGACSYTPPEQNTAPASQVGGTGDLQYSHEELGAQKHLLSITAAPGLFETESSIKQRIHIFANKFAAQTCTPFSFIDDPNFDQQMAFGFMKRTRTYVFQCE